MAELGTQFANDIQSAAPDWNQYLAWLKANGGAGAVPEQPAAPAPAPAPAPEGPAAAAASMVTGAPAFGGPNVSGQVPLNQPAPPEPELPQPSKLNRIAGAIASGVANLPVALRQASDQQLAGPSTEGNPVGEAAGNIVMSGVPTKLPFGALPTQAALRGGELAANARRGRRPIYSTEAPAAAAPPKSHNMPPEELPIERGGYGPESRAAIEQMTGEGPVPEPRVKVPETLTEAVVDAGKGFREKATAKTNKQMAEARSGLRDLSTDQAIAAVRSNPHLQAREADGSFVGAPKQIKTEQQVAEVRNRMDESIALGAGVGGDKWYPRGRAAVSELTRGDPAGGRLMAGSLGVTSAQATPETNLGFELQAHNNYLMGNPLKIAHTGATARNLNKARDLGTDTVAGPKTFVYQQNLDPSEPFSTTGVNDIWMARMMEYFDEKGRPWDKELSAKQHAWMDHETMAAVDRANLMRLGGRDNWQAHEIQAAGWVGRKAQSEAAKKGIPIEQALKEARIEYDDFINKHTAYGTYDELPGRMTGHGTNLLEGGETGRVAREAYLEDPRSTWTNKTGHDVIYSAFGEEPRLKPRERRSVPTTSVYTSGEPGAPTEISTGGAARPLVSLAGGTGARRMDEASRKMLELAETFRAAMGTQEMGAASALFPSNKSGLARSVRFNTGAMTPEQVLAAKDIGAKHGVPDFVHYGEDRGGLLTKFGDNDRPGTSDQRALREAVDGKRDKPGPMGEELAKVFKDPQPERTDVQSVTAWLGDKWAAGEGSGQVTKHLLETFDNPLHRSWVDGSPELRANIAARMERDIEHIKNTGAPYRQDAENLKRVFAEQGLDGVEREMKAGRIAFPVVAAIMGPALYEVVAGQGQAQAAPGPGN